MATSSRDGAAGLIGGAYAVDFSTALATAPPLQAWPAQRAGQAGHMAVAVARGWPARARALGALTGAAMPNLLAPVAHGPAPTPNGDTGYFVVCQLPPGPSLAAALRPWPEAELMEQLLKPAAQALGALQARNVTHRAIRADNVFQAEPRTPVTLGCAWAAPPACHQPGWMEPPFSAGCLATGRGDGVAADDVYALGALMVMCSLGVNPVQDIAEADLLRRKLDIGSYAAIVGNHRLPANVAEILRGMLADDPEHRPSPALLSNPAAARARRVAARPPRRAQRPLDIGAHGAWTARMLAHEIASDPAAGVRLLRDGSVGRWVRRGLGDSIAAGQIDTVIQQHEGEAAAGNERAEPLLVTRAVAVLDPAAAMVWRGLSLWPDGLGPALDHALRHAPDQAAALTEIALERVGITWEERRATAQDGLGAQAAMPDMRGWFAGGKASTGPLRLAYTLNPLTPCDSPLTGASWVTRLVDLLPALEAQVARSKQAAPALVDASIAAFIEARRDDRLDADLNRLAASLKAGDALSQTRLLGRLQDKLLPGPMPQLSRRACELMQPLLDGFSSRSRRERMARQLTVLAEAGHLAPMIELIDDSLEHSRDADGLAAAHERLAEIEAALAGIAAGSDGQSVKVRRLSGEVAEGVGLAACVTALGFALFG